jgi:hypothetical protein
MAVLDFAKTQELQHTENRKQQSQELNASDSAQRYGEPRANENEDPCDCEPSTNSLVRKMLENACRH